MYRGIRGELPSSFWLRDAFGAVTATDFGFMSTSLDRAVSESFLGQNGSAVLWKIECSEESDDGFHSAADVSLLSQFPEQQEMLFPPMTMLQVQSTRQSGTSARESITSLSTHESGTTAKGVAYICITVKPTFI